MLEKHRLQSDVRMGSAYLLSDLAWIREKYWPGKILIVTKSNYEYAAGGRRVKVRKVKEYTAEKLYRYHLSCIDSNGQRESFNYFDLETMAR